MIADACHRLPDRLTQSARSCHDIPVCTAGGGMMDVCCYCPCLVRWQRIRASGRAEALQRGIRVVPPQPLEVIISLLGHLFNPQDTTDTIQSLCIGENQRHEGHWMLPVPFGRRAPRPADSEVQVLVTEMPLFAGSNSEYCMHG
jgi:hypothetical protein